jgi:hypothetical protein
METIIYELQNNLKSVLCFVDFDDIDDIDNIIIDAMHKSTDTSIRIINVGVSDVSTDTIITVDDIESDLDAIASALNNNTSVHTLYILNLYKSSSIKFNFSKILNNTTIKYIHIDSPINAKQLTDIGNILHTNKSVTKLVLNSHYSYPNGIKLIIRALCTNNTLKYLKITNRTISKDVIIEMCEMIKINNGLKKLKIDCDENDFDDFIPFFSSLKDNNTLTNLKIDNLYGNNLDIASIIEPNCALQQFNIGYQNSTELVRILERNKQYQTEKRFKCQKALVH